LTNTAQGSGLHSSKVSSLIHFNTKWICEIGR